MGKSIGFPQLSDDELVQEILPEVYHWALCNGLVMYPPHYSPDQVGIAPTTLYPTPLPKHSFETAVSVQKAYNELYAKISQDTNDGWLSKETAKLAEFDREFTGRLWKLYVRAKEEGISQKLRLGVFRSDYLIDKKEDEIKQVEFNTVSVSFGGLSRKVGELHNFLNESGGYSPASGSSFYKSEIPISQSDVLLADGLAAAVKLYDSQKSDPIVAFIIQNHERNVFDQRIIEYNLLQRHKIKSVRLTLDELHVHTSVDPKNKRLFLKNSGQEIALVYFRSGYAPPDFKNEKTWENRLVLETSYAIKAPDLLTQLSGTKKIQQLLTNEGILAKFISDESIRKQLKSTFAKIYPLDDSSLGKEGKKIAFEMPSKYVLKPQREGGGNNIYKEDIPAFLNKISEDEWSAYILMELIEPSPTIENVVLRGTDFFREPIVSELGIFGCILFDDNTIHFNEYSGWLLRSKFNSSNEGGVAAGFGCVDSLVLY